jgi:hypothetical protein
VVSLLPGKAQFSAIYGTCCIKLVRSSTTYVFLSQGIKRTSGRKRDEETNKELLHLIVSSGFCVSFETMCISAFIHFQSRILTCQSRHNQRHNAEGILWFGGVSLPKGSELCILAYMYILIQATLQIKKTP